MNDEGGVLGNLPRSRPGRRSEKRTQPNAKSKPQANAGRPASTRPKPSAGARRASTDERPARNPVGDAVRVVTGVALTGPRMADRLAREVLRRLPRP